MEEYIKRSDVLNNIESLKKSPWYNDDNSFGSRIIKKDAVDIVTDLCVKAVLVADVKEVVHGKWKFDSYTAKYGNPYRCSVCGEEHADTYQYCPDCGAIMDLK